jgi:hypothetical protein
MRLTSSRGLVAEFGKAKRDENRDNVSGRIGR